MPASRTRVETLLSMYALANGQQRTCEDAQSLLEVSEAELVSARGDLVNQGVRELHILVALQLVLPVLGIQSTLVTVGVVEEPG